MRERIIEPSWLQGGVENIKAKKKMGGEGIAPSPPVVKRLWSLQTGYD
jgi:hypothetical protein